MNVCVSELSEERIPTFKWIRPQFCQDPPDATKALGISCYAAFPKYTFDSNKGRCVHYSYGGCSGTQNLFETELECQITCSNLQPLTSYTYYLIS